VTRPAARLERGVYRYRPRADPAHLGTAVLVTDSRGVEVMRYHTGATGERPRRGPTAPHRLTRAA